MSDRYKRIGESDALRTMGVRSLYYIDYRDRRGHNGMIELYQRGRSEPILFAADDGSAMVEMLEHMRESGISIDDVDTSRIDDIDSLWRGVRR